MPTEEPDAQVSANQTAKAVRAERTVEVDQLAAEPEAEPKADQREADTPHPAVLAEIVDTPAPMVAKTVIATAPPSPTALVAPVSHATATPDEVAILLKTAVAKGHATPAPLPKTERKARRDYGGLVALIVVFAAIIGYASLLKSQQRRDRGR